jgi:hypothetical protein
VTVRTLVFYEQFVRAMGNTCFAVSLIRPILVSLIKSAATLAAPSAPFGTLDQEIFEKERTLATV